MLNASALLAKPRVSKNNRGPAPPAPCVFLRLASAKVYPILRKQLAHIVDARVERRQDQVRRRQLVRRQRGPRPDQAHSAVKRGAERRLVIPVDRRVKLEVKRGKLRRLGLVQLVLPLAENPHYHD